MPKAAKVSLQRRKEKLVHPNSRQASRLSQKQHRDQRVDGRVKERNNKLEQQGERCRWFQERLQPDKATYSKQECAALVELYLGRFEDELEQIAIKQGMKGRDGLQHVSRLDAIRMTRATEQ